MRMRNNRAFHCSVPVYDSNILVTGGYSGDSNKTVLKSVENVAVSLNWTGGNLGWREDWSSMKESRSGHGCTGSSSTK